MKFPYETRKIRLYPVSPIHISAGETRLGPTDIELDKTIYIIDEEQLARHVFNNKSLLKTYVEYASEWATKKVYIKDYFDESGRLDRQFYQDRDQKEHTLQYFLERKMGMNIREFIDEIQVRTYPATTTEDFMCDGQGNPFIPGSSLKGAIRTAIFYKLFQENKRFNLNAKVSEFFRKNGKPGRNQLQNLFMELLTFSCQNYKFKEELSQKDSNATGRTASKIRTKYPKNGPNRDFLSCLQISDAPVNQISSEKYNVKVLSCNRGAGVFKLKKGKEISIPKQLVWPDDIPETEPVEFTLTLDKEKLNQFQPVNRDGFRIPFQNLAGLQTIVQEFFERVWLEEQKFFCGVSRAVLTGNPHAEGTLGPDLRTNRQKLEPVIDFYHHQTTPNFRLGFGSGLLGTTLFCLLNQDNRKKIRNVINKGYRDLPAPKSRRLVVAYNEMLPLGWARLEFGE